jgi:ATP sulfurylase
LFWAESSRTKIVLGRDHAGIGDDRCDAAKTKTFLLELRRGFGVIPATTRHVTQSDLKGD